MMNDQKIRATLRIMAWERAKGELRALVHTYWDETDRFEVADAAIEQFIKQHDRDETFV